MLPVLTDVYHLVFRRRLIFGMRFGRASRDFGEDFPFSTAAIRKPAGATCFVRG
jgi:hypothetical protein